MAVEEVLRKQGPDWYNAFAGPVLSACVAVSFGAPVVTWILRGQHQIPRMPTGV